MAFSFKFSRYSAMIQIVLGALSIVFGVADRATMYSQNAFHTESVTPIWMGFWFVFTGVIGCFATSHKYANNGRASRPLIGTYLGFSIVSIVFAAVIIILYIMGVLFAITNGGSCRNTYYYDQGQNQYKTTWSLEQKCNTSVALGSLIIIFAIVEFGVGIWASICCCSNGCCDCCNPTEQQPQMGQVFYVQTQQGPTPYVMTQGANGVPVAVPAVSPGQIQMNPVQAPQVMYPASAYTPGGTGGGASGGGVTGGGGTGGVGTGGTPHGAHPLEPIRPSYQVSV